MSDAQTVLVVTLPRTDAWRDHLLADGCTEDHADRSVSRVRRLIKLAADQGRDCRKLDQLRSTIEVLCREGVSPSTANHYLQAAGAFLKWMGHPVPKVKRFRTVGRMRRERRALTSEEIKRLIDATRNSGPVSGVTGPVRALIYRIALETGLRAGEILDLTWNRIAIGEKPNILARAGYTKSGREDVCPISAKLASDLGRIRVACGAADNDRLFDMPRWKIWQMFPKDLKRAEVKGKIDGKVVDFHALRHTAITDVYKHTHDLALTQAFARHGSVGMTRRYIHVDAAKLHELAEERRIG